MCQTSLVRVNGHLCAYSFTTGVKPVKLKVRKTDDEIQAECLRLVREGRIEESNELLDHYYPPRE